MSEVRLSSRGPRGLPAFANPDSLAILGVSANPLKWGHRILAHIVAGGYTGRIYPINPKGGEVLGLEVWPSLASLPEAPDVVLVAVPASQAAQAVKEAAAASVKAVAVISAGFAEAGNAQAEEELARVAREEGIALVGPNSMGFFTARRSLHAMMSAARPQVGGVSLVSQSGNIGTQAMARSHLHGTGFSLFFSLGNAAVLDFPDYLEFLAEDDQTRVIALYIEGVKDGEAFLESLARASAAKPVLVAKGGRSAPGFRAASSHSAALATPEALFSSVVRQAGGLLTASVEEMMDAAAALDLMPLPRGPRVAVLTWGGGWGVVAADACAQAGLEVAEPSPETVSALDRLLPPYWSRGNPVDLVGTLDHPAHMEALRILARAPEFDSVLVLGLISAPDPYATWEETQADAVVSLWSREVVEEMDRLARETGKPLLGVLMSGGPAPPPEARGKVPIYPTPERAVRALAHMVARSRWLQTHAVEVGSAGPGAAQGLPGPAEAAREEVRGWIAGLPPGCRLSEGESLKILEAWGIPCVARRIVKTLEEAALAAGELGYPVVLKATGRGIAHKTERGLVRAGISSEEELARAFSFLKSRLRPGEAEGFLVESMLSSSRELAMGAVRDPVFGPCIIFGLGGILAEALREVSFRHAPLGLADAMEMLTEVRAGSLLGPVRGEPEADLGELARCLISLGELMLDLPEVAEVDVNPVLLPGGHPVAVDALVVLGATGPARTR